MPALHQHVAKDQYVAKAVAARVLLIDDHRPNLTVLEAILEPLQMELIAAPSAEDALLLVAQVDLAAILTDLRMTGMSGVEFAKWVRSGARNAHVPIVILSGVDDDDPQVREALKLPGVYFMQKPSAPPALRALVRELAGV